MAQHTWPDDEPHEVVLAAGDARLAVDLRGGGLRRLVVDDWDVIDGYPAGAVAGGLARAPCCVPWPNRVRDGRWTWHGARTAARRALAGRSRTRSTAWSPGSRGPSSTDGDRPPPWGRCSSRTRATPSGSPSPSTTTLAPDRLDGHDAGAQPRHRGRPRSVSGCTRTCTSGRTRTAASAAPSSPFRPGRRWTPRAGCPPAPRTGSTGTSAGSVTGRSTPRSPTWSATTTAGPGCGCAGRSGELVLAVDEAWPWLQIYTGDTLPEGQRRRSLAVEPMTCPPNALADGRDLVVLEPGGDWSGTWTLGWTAAR